MFLWVYAWHLFIFVIKNRTAASLERNEQVQHKKGCEETEKLHMSDAPVCFFYGSACSVFPSPLWEWRLFIFCFFKQNRCLT
jgi:hypothetical protein